MLLQPYSLDSIEPFDVPALEGSGAFSSSPFDGLTLGSPSRWPRLSTSGCHRSRASSSTAGGGRIR